MYLVCECNQCRATFKFLSNALIFHITIVVNGTKCQIFSTSVSLFFIANKIAFHFTCSKKLCNKKMKLKKWSLNLCLLRQLPP